MDFYGVQQRAVLTLVRALIFLQELNNNNRHVTLIYARNTPLEVTLEAFVKLATTWEFPARTPSAKASMCGKRT
jgi:hypothetical protein